MIADSFFPMTFHRLAGLAATTLLLLSSAFAIGTRGVSAAEGDPPGPDRYAAVTETYTLYGWWLASWATNQVACTIMIDREGLPNSSEIAADCGQDLYQAWAATGICSQSQLASGSCQGYYLIFYGSEQARRPLVATQTYTSYEWWLTSWSTNKVACTLRVDHEEMPTGEEIQAICGEGIYDAWLATGSCSLSDLNAGKCAGYYIVYARSEQLERHENVKLPPPVVWLTLDGCYPYRSTFRCDDLPTLVLTGEEPLAGEYITGLAGRIDGRPFECDPVCQVDLAPTGLDGMTIEFWAYSSYGDSSELFTARVRVAASDDPTDDFWYTDILSSQWRGDPLAPGSQTWGAFPPVGGVPSWLATPQRPEDLATNIPYEYLAAKLIEQGLVDVSACMDGGLVGPDLVSPCGMEASRLDVADWQNRFDELIFAAAQQVGIPAQLLKNIFSRESQFWPGLSLEKPEAGLGQLTSGGADTALLWNRPFYEQFCPTVLDDAVCRRGYSQLQERQQVVLRDSLVASVNAFCSDCPLGIDLEKADRSVEVFAETLLADSEQAGQIVRNTYNADPGAVSSYEDLWRFTLVNYNAGPGCLTLAVQAVVSQGEPLDWDHLSSHLTPVCWAAFDYVSDVSRTSP